MILGFHTTLLLTLVFILFSESHAFFGFRYYNQQRSNKVVRCNQNQVKKQVRKSWIDTSMVYKCFDKCKPGYELKKDWTKTTYTCYKSCPAGQQLVSQGYFYVCSTTCKEGYVKFNTNLSRPNFKCFKKCPPGEIFHKTTISGSSTLDIRCFKKCRNDETFEKKDGKWGCYRIQCPPKYNLVPFKGGSLYHCKKITCYRSQYLGKHNGQWKCLERCNGYGLVKHPKDPTQCLKKCKKSGDHYKMIDGTPKCVPLCSYFKEIQFIHGKYQCVQKTCKSGYFLHKDSEKRKATCKKILKCSKGKHFDRNLAACSSSCQTGMNLINGKCISVVCSRGQIKKKVNGKWICESIECSWGKILKITKDYSRCIKIKCNSNEKLIKEDGKYHCTPICEGPRYIRKESTKFSCKEQPCRGKYFCEEQACPKCHVWGRSSTMEWKCLRKRNKKTDDGKFTILACGTSCPVGEVYMFHSGYGRNICFHCNGDERIYKLEKQEGNPKYPQHGCCNIKTHRLKNGQCVKKQIISGPGRYNGPRTGLTKNCSKYYWGRSWDPVNKRYRFKTPKRLCVPDYYIWDTKHSEWIPPPPYHTKSKGGLFSKLPFGTTI